MTAITAIEAQNLPNVRDVRLRLPMEADDEPTHLVLVGPNGSGKTSMLESIVDELEANLDGRAHPVHLLELSEGERSQGGTDRIQLEQRRRLAYMGRPLRLEWSRTLSSIPDDFEAGLLVTAALPARRDGFLLDPSSGADGFDTQPRRPRSRVANRLLGLIEHHRVAAELSRAAHDELRAQTYEAWMLRVQANLRRLLDDSSLRLEQRRGLACIVDRQGSSRELSQLSRGHFSAVRVWSELMIRVEAARMRADRPTLAPSCVFVIDLPEADLDPRLQQHLLPALEALFPGLQLVVSTNSPLVATSLGRSVVANLAAGSAVSGMNLREMSFEDVVGVMSAHGTQPRWDEVTDPAGGVMPSVRPSRTTLPVGRMQVSSVTSLDDDVEGEREEHLAGRSVTIPAGSSFDE